MLPTGFFNDPEVLALIAGVFLFAGVVKGTVGLGLPTVSLGILTATVGLKAAIALMLIPSLSTNIFQALSGPYFRDVMRRLWRFFALVCIGTWAGAEVLVAANPDLLAGLLGLVLVFYAVFSLTLFQVPPPGRWEPWLSPPIGLVSGLVTGLTGSFIVPGSLYLQALGMPRDQLIQALGISFTIVTVALLAAITSHGLVTAEIGATSIMAVVPAGLGMIAGAKLRQRISEERFRRIFFLALLAMGAYITVRSFT